MCVIVGPSASVRARMCGRVSCARHCAKLHGCRPRCCCVTKLSSSIFACSNCDHLNKRYTVFGKVTGETIYNLLKMDSVEVGEGDRPVHPPKSVLRLVGLPVL